MFDITPEDMDKTALTPSTSSLKLQLPCKGREEQDSVLLAKEGAEGEVNPGVKRSRVAASNFTDIAESRFILAL